MDVEINFIMTCPAITKQQCKIWEQAIVGIVLVICVTAVTIRFDDWSMFKQAVTGLAITGCVLWSLWIVRAFYGIITWWAEMRDSVNQAQQILAEAKQDLRDIKNIVSSQNSQ